MRIEDLKNSILRAVDKHAKKVQEKQEALKEANTAVVGDQEDPEYAELANHLEELKTVNPDLHRKIVTLY